jgi:hypothetical protein
VSSAGSLIRTATRSAVCVRGMRIPRVAAALPALPEATLLTPLCGALAATRQYETINVAVR